MTDQDAQREDRCPTCLLVLAIGPSACDDLQRAGGAEREFLTPAAVT